MKNVMKLTLIAMVAATAVGCASTSDIDNLQAQIDGLKTSVAQASSDAASAQSAAAVLLQKLLLLKLLLTVLPSTHKTLTANWTACSKNQ